MKINPYRAQPRQIAAGAPLERRTPRDQDPIHIAKGRNRDPVRDQEIMVEGEKAAELMRL